MESSTGHLFITTDSLTGSTHCSLMPSKKSLTVTVFISACTCLRIKNRTLNRNIFPGRFMLTTLLLKKDKSPCMSYSSQKRALHHSVRRKMSASYQLAAAAGGQGGSWYVLLEGLARLVHQVHPEIEVQVVEGGGVSNHTLVGSGELPMAILNPPMTAAALAGTAHWC